MEEAPLAPLPVPGPGVELKGGRSTFNEENDVLLFIFFYSRPLRNRLVFVCLFVCWLVGLFVLVEVAVICLSRCQSQKNNFETFSNMQKKQDVCHVSLPQQIGGFFFFLSRPETTRTR